jgi:hypothetical protein
MTYAFGGGAERSGPILAVVCFTSGGAEPSTRANILPIFGADPLRKNHRTLLLPFCSVSFRSSLVPSQPPPETCAPWPATTTVSAACIHGSELVAPYASARSWCHIPWPSRPGRPWRELTPNHHPSRARCWSPWSLRPSPHPLACRVACALFVSSTITTTSHGARRRRLPA